MPKSVTFNTLSSPKRTFSGFMSRCRTPCWWAPLRPEHATIAMAQAVRWSNPRFDEPTPDGAAGQPLHDQDAGVIVLDVVVDRNDVRVVDRRQDLCFSQEPGAHRTRRSPARAPAA